MSEPESRALAVERYLTSGRDEPTYRAPGTPAHRQLVSDEELLDALVKETLRRSVGRQHRPVPDLDLAPWTRRKLTPMVSGLFPRAEQEAVLALFEKSVVFLTPDNIERVLLGQRWLHTAWDLANVYLLSVGANLLGPEAVPLLGLSEETTCYVSAAYFDDRGKTEAFVIHEAAHVFHNCKRHTVGLPETRTREWLLPIAFGKRETFAYACEAYGGIVEHASKRPDRLARAVAFAEHEARVNDDTVDPAELADIVREACGARNGWKVILGRCAPPKAARLELTARQAPSPDGT